MATKGHVSNVITKTRQATTALLGAYDSLIALRIEWNNGMQAAAVNSTNTTDPTVPGFTYGSFDGENFGLTKADINQVLGAALTALDTIINGLDGKKMEDIRY